jgi:hypothetical protein
MLRHYDSIPYWSLIEEAIADFISVPPRLALIGYDNLSPDSFIWKLYDGSKVYYLYAEDYVESLAYVRETLLEFADKDTAIDFLPVKKPLAFEDSSPNTSADIYKPPSGEYDFMRYATSSGYDFVFLAVSDERL